MLDGEFKFSKTYRRNLSVIYYDLDFFKKVNDNYGHGAGDLVLRESAQLVRTCVRKDDVFGRYGGEEFVIVLPNTDQKTAADLAERIRASLEAHTFQLEIEKDGKRGVVQHKQTISAGVSQLTPDIATYELLLESADKKLYTSKQTGRNRVTV